MTTIDREHLRKLAAYYSLGDPRMIAGMSWGEIVALLDALDAAEAQVQRVRELHQPEASDAFPACPEGCCGWCEGCGLPTPCPTIRALDGEDA